MTTTTKVSVSLKELAKKPELLAGGHRLCAEIGGFTVLSCNSGEEALAAAPGFAPELLLIDMNMPGMDGMTLLARFREAGMSVPAIFFTARINPSDLERYRAAGAIGTLSKPFDPLKLGRQFTQIWMENQPAQEGGP